MLPLKNIQLLIMQNVVIVRQPVYSQTSPHLLVLYTSTSPSLLTHLSRRYEPPLFLLFSSYTCISPILLVSSSVIAKLFHKYLNCNINQAHAMFCASRHPYVIFSCDNSLETLDTVSGKIQFLRSHASLLLLPTRVFTKIEFHSLYNQFSCKIRTLIC